jgi:hypothetical protein
MLTRAKNSGKIETVQMGSADIKTLTIKPHPIFSSKKSASLHRNEGWRFTIINGSVVRCLSGKLDKILLIANY